MSDKKTHSLPDQPGSLFLNRGLFSDHFLQALLPKWKDWEVDAELGPFHDSLLSLYKSKKPILPYLNEAQTELEFVQPVLDLLGYANSYIVQAPTKVAQKWLKDRKGKTLTYDDLTHYQRVIVALKETSRLMGEIDELIPEWPVD